ncbi:MAG: hypothetical protein JWM57_1577 [Phycisphaerales bacterium]|nr:hypothetical protein [Phycisphaerales bacterium]
MAKKKVTKRGTPQRTAAQTKAARSNGAKSKGPRTAVGKAASSQNALKHGLFARRLMPRNDVIDASLYARHYKNLIADYRPVDTQGLEVLATIACDQVLLIRLRKAEQAMLKPPLRGDEIEILRLLRDDKRFLRNMKKAILFLWGDGRTKAMSSWAADGIATRVRDRVREVVRDVKMVHFGQGEFGSHAYGDEVDGHSDTTDYELNPEPGETENAYKQRLADAFRALKEDMNEGAADPEETAKERDFLERFEALGDQIGPLRDVDLIVGVLTGEQKLAPEALTIWLAMFASIAEGTRLACATWKRKLVRQAAPEAAFLFALSKAMAPLISVRHYISMVENTILRHQKLIMSMVEQRLRQESANALARRRGTD